MNNYNNEENLTKEDLLCLLRAAMAAEASDVHLAADLPPYWRSEGRLVRQAAAPVSEELLQELLTEMTGEEKRMALRLQGECDFAWSFGGRRFRVNAFRQHTGTALALRLVPQRVPALAELSAPQVLTDLQTATSGLILVTGPTGAGKTTTLAAFLQELAARRAAHIITLEDPIEYVYTSGQSLINQRELETDFVEMAGALRGALREDPDVILVGELRDRDTVRTALQAAETGHLVLATLHTATAAEAVLRLESFFAAEAQGELRAELAAVLLAVVAQQLLPRQGGGRVAAFEVMTATPAVRNLIRTGKAHQLPSLLMSGAAQGMQTMGQAVRQLAAAGRIEQAAAQRFL